MLMFVLKKVRELLLSLLVLCALCAVAQAQQGQSQAESWQHYLLSSLLTLFVTVLTAAVPIVLPKVLSLLHLQKSAILNDEIQGIISDAVAHGQAWVQAQIDQKAPPPSPNAVQNKVMQYVVDQLKARGLPAQLGSYLENLVTAELGRLAPPQTASAVQSHAAMKAAFFRA